MALFGKAPKTKIFKTDIAEEFRPMREQLAGGYSSLLERGEAATERLGDWMQPAQERMGAALAGGEIYGPEQQQALGVARGLMGTQAGDIWQWNPEAEETAIRTGYEKEIPEAMLRQLEAMPGGSMYGRARREAGRVGGDLYSDMLARLAESKRYGAERGMGAELAAQQARGAGAQMGYGWGDILGRQAEIAKMLGGMEQMGIAPYMQAMQLAGQFPVQTWSPQYQMYQEAGKPGVLGQVAGAMGGLGQMIAPFMGGGGFSSLISGRQQPMQNPYMDPSYLQWMTQ